MLSAEHPSSTGHRLTPIANTKSLARAGDVRVSGPSRAGNFSKPRAAAVRPPCGLPFQAWLFSVRYRPADVRKRRLNAFANAGDDS